jgi:hypothetical protein
MENMGVQVLFHFLTNKQMTNNPRNAGRKPVPNGVLVKTTVPKNKVKKLKDYSKELIKEYYDERIQTK